jgi:dihydrofolate reductase
MHVSLDGFVAGPRGEMDWIKLDDELWEYVESITNEADSAVYGEHTFKLMESYWPTAAERPNATKHDIDHARWANAVEKIVFSNSITHSNWAGTRFLKGDPDEEMRKIKAQPGKNLLMLGSPTLAQEFMERSLIDEFRLNINPVVIGAGLPLFASGIYINLGLVAAKSFVSGVVALHYDLSS